MANRWTPEEAQRWEDAVRDLVQLLAEVPTQWTDEAQSFVGAEYPAQVFLEVVEERAIGVDEPRYVFDAGATGAEVTPSLFGLRRVTLQVRVESYVQRGSTSARFFLERIRSRLRRGVAADVLRDLDTALVAVGPTLVTQAPANVRDNRAISLAAMRVELTHGRRENDVAGSFIDRVQGQGVVTDPAGTVVLDEPHDIDLPD